MVKSQRRQLHGPVEVHHRGLVVAVAMQPGRQATLHPRLLELLGGRVDVVSGLVGVEGQGVVAHPLAELVVVHLAVDLGELTELVVARGDHRRPHHPVVLVDPHHAGHVHHPVQLGDAMVGVDQHRELRVRVGRLHPGAGRLDVVVERDAQHLEAGRGQLVAQRLPGRQLVATAAPAGPGHDGPLAVGSTPTAGGCGRPGRAGRRRGPRATRAPPGAGPRRRPARPPDDRRRSPPPDPAPGPARPRRPSRRRRTRRGAVAAPARTPRRGTAPRP